MPDFLLRCGNPHPLGRVQPEFAVSHGRGDIHGAEVAVSPVPVDLTSFRIVHRSQEVRLGEAAGYCRECRRWTAYPTVAVEGGLG